MWERQRKLTKKDLKNAAFTKSFSAQSGAASPAYHHSASIQGLHNIHGSFNVPNMPGTLGSRNTTINNVPSSGVQQSAGNLSSGRFVRDDKQRWYECRRKCWI
ncbi:general transcription factor [Lithospermum erythrorhizon]|uniref:General transcription factor n=1 Tax=Lithospermum erythrorhizon TaxID=34254 RepID=A0AAV3P3V5_LITER